MKSNIWSQQLPSHLSSCDSLVTGCPASYLCILIVSAPQNSLSNPSKTCQVASVCCWIPWSGFTFHVRAKALLTSRHYMKWFPSLLQPSLWLLFPHFLYSGQTNLLALLPKFQQDPALGLLPWCDCVIFLYALSLGISRAISSISSHFPLNLTFSTLFMQFEIAICPSTHSRSLYISIFL